MVAGVTALHLMHKLGHYTINVTPFHFLLLPSLPGLTSCSLLPSDFPWVQVLGWVLYILEEQVQGSSTLSHQDSKAELSLRIRGGNWQDQTPD